MEKNKIKLLRVLDIIKKTDEDSPITANEICQKLKLYGIDAERKSVCRDINTLIDYGYDINLMSDNKLGFYFGERTLENWQIKILIDAISRAKFLTDKNSKELIEKLISFASSESRKMLKKITPVKSDIKSDNKTTKINIDVILKAIKQNKKICFKYTYINKDKKSELRRDGKEYIVNPYSLLWKNDRYYLIGNYDKYDDLSYYRLDKITDLKTSDETIKSLKNILGENADLKLNEFVKRNLYNYVGEKISLTLEFDESTIDDIVDYFGNDITFTNVNDKIRTCVNTTLSNGLYFWLLQFGEYVKVISPEEVKNTLVEKAQSIIDKYK